MRAICKYSGLQFQTQYFPYSFKNSQLHHPVFDIPFPDLLSLSNDWLDSERYTLIDKRLMFLALLRSTELIQFRTYARPSDSTISQNMDSAIEWAAFIHGLKSEEQLACLPRYVISADNATLLHVDGWFTTWRDAIAEYKDQYRSYNAAQIQVRREEALSRLIKDPNRTTESYAKLLTEWAAVAASFPTGLITNPAHPAEQITLHDYWCDLMRKCGNKSFSIWKLNRNDLDELQEHLEYNLPHGTIVAHEALALVRTAIVRHDSAFGIMQYDSPAFTILDPKDSVEKANALAAAAMAPAIEPTPQDYPSKAAYLLAMARWRIAQRLNTGREEAEKLGL